MKFRDIRELLQFSTPFSDCLYRVSCASCWRLGLDVTELCR